MIKTAAFGTLALAAIALPVFAMAPTSGLNVGERVSAFHPTHVAGPDAGTDTCPPCKYGNRPMVQVWTNMDDPANVMAIVKNLEKKVGASKNELKAFVINLTHCQACVDGTKELGKKAGATNVGIAHLPSDHEAVKLYRVNTDESVKNTVFVYRNRTVAARFVNLKADEAGLKALNEAIAKVDN